MWDLHVSCDFENYIHNSCIWYEIFINGALARFKFNGGFGWNFLWNALKIREFGEMCFKIFKKI